MNPKENTKEHLPINEQDAWERLGGDKAFLEELINIFCEHFEKQTADLKKAIGEKNYQTIREIGHSLKGAAANLSLSPFRQAAYEMEKAGIEHNLSNAKKTLLLLTHEYERLREYLKKKNAG